VRSINPVVGETNDGMLNDIRGRHVGRAEVFEAIHSAKGGPVEEGCVGAGTGTIAFGWKGGIGSSSRQVSGFIIGVLVQSNFGGELRIPGAPKRDAATGGSIMIVVATNAPVDYRNLRRLAERAVWGMARSGGAGSNGSGDYAIAFSTVRNNPSMLSNDNMSPLFAAVMDATEEAIYNSLFKAVTTTGNGLTIKALPLEGISRSALQ
jgi:D-aminopeptidase